MLIGFAQLSDKLKFAEVKIKVIPEIAEWRVKSEDTRKGALSKNTTSYFHNHLHRFPFSFISTLHSSIFTLSCKFLFVGQLSKTDKHFYECAPVRTLEWGEYERRRTIRTPPGLRLARPPS